MILNSMARINALMEEAGGTGVPRHSRGAPRRGASSGVSWGGGAAAAEGGWLAGAEGGLALQILCKRALDLQGSGDGGG